MNRRVAAAAEAVLAIDVACEELDSLATASQLEDLLGRERMLTALGDSYRQAILERHAAIESANIETGRRNELVHRASELKDKAETLRMERSMLDARPLDDGARCDHCGQVLGFEGREERLQKYEQDAVAFDEQARGLEAQALSIVLPEIPDEPAPPTVDGDTVANHVLRVQSLIAAARNDQAQRGRLDERIVQLQRDVDQRPAFDDVERVGSIVSAKQASLDELEPVDLTVIEKTGQLARANHVAAQAVREQAIAANARATERLAQTRAAEAKLAERAAETKALQADVDRDLLLERAYGRDGIPALIIENTAIPYIETEASRILGLLGTSFQVELRTQAENKTGGLRDTLDVVVIDPDGNEADFADGCSGGEQTRVGLALRIALARLLAHRRGAESRLLALDEPSYLDQAGMATLLDVLRGLEADFDVILLVSHVAELRDALDQTIVVVKENGRSSVDGAPVPVEAIAA